MGRHACRAVTRWAIGLTALIVMQDPGPSPAWAAVVNPAVTPRRFYIANDDHTDYFWSGTDLQYRTAFLNMLDYYMTQAENTTANPPDSRGRFNCDGSIWAWEYEHNKSASSFQRLISHIRNGAISMPLQSAVLLPGAMPTEAVLRDMYYAGRLERRENLRFPLALAMENQTLPGGIASLWAGAGARYSWKGVCSCTAFHPGPRPRDIYHFAGPDGQSVCMKWHDLENVPGLGSYGEAPDPQGAVSYLETDPGMQQRWPWPVAAAFGHGWDAFQTTTNEFVETSLALSNPDRRVIVSNEVDFFEDFLTSHSDEIPIVSGSFGNDWDLLTSSMAAVTAEFRRKVEKLRTAEALATVAALHDPAFLAGREVVRDSAFLACGLYYEHDWTADGLASAGRAAWQRRMLTTLARYVDTLQADGLAWLGQEVAAPVGVERHVVFNPLGWARTDVVDLQAVMADPCHVVDVTSGSQVRSQRVVVDGQSRLRVLASDVPSVGYRVYEVRSGAGTVFPAAATVTTSTADNGLYAVTLGGRGQLSSLIDRKNTNRELVDLASGKGLNDLEHGNGTPYVETSGAVSATLRVVAGGLPAHEMRVTLHAGIDRVDLEARITQNFSSVEDYLYPFALSEAVIRHEEVGMIARVARASQGGDYADQNARTDYLTLNHFLDVSQYAYGVTLSSAESPFFKPGASTMTFLDSSSPRVRVVVGMQVDGPSLGIDNQGGDALFVNRYALRTHAAYDPVAAMRFALEHQNPLVSARVLGGAGTVLPATTWSLMNVTTPDILLWALKPAEEGIAAGVVARFWNLAEGSRSLSASMPVAPIQSAQVCTHVETDLGPATVSAGALQGSFARQQIKTYRLVPQSLITAVERVLGPHQRVVTVSPNPARAKIERRITTLLPRSGRVRVTLHDLRGGRVAVLADEEAMAGLRSWTWAAASHRLRPGIYLVRVEAPEFTGSSKLVVLGR